MRTRRDLLVCLLALFEACVLAPVVSARVASEDLAVRVITLMKRALATELPARLPPDVKQRVPEHAAEEYEQYHRFVPGEGFFEPEFVKRSDPGLYRELKKFWGLSPAKQIQIVPYLGEQYFHAERPVQKMTIRLIDELSEEAFDVPGRDNLVVQTCLTLLERSPIKEDKNELLKNTLSGVRISEVGYQRLLSLAQQWDHADVDLRQTIIRLLAGGRNDTVPPQVVSQYVLDVAKSDTCRECRRAAVSYWQVRYLGCAVALPIYLANFDEAIRSGDVATANVVMMAVGIKGKCVQAVPRLIEALGTANVATQAMVVTTLENILGIDKSSVPKEFQIFSIDYEKPEPDAVALDRLVRATGRWKAWWANVGAHLLQDQGPDAVRDKASGIYVTPLC